MSFSVRSIAVMASISTGLAFAVLAPSAASSTAGLSNGEQLARTIRRPAPVNPTAPPRTAPPKPVSLC